MVEQERQERVQQKHAFQLLQIQLSSSGYRVARCAQYVLETLQTVVLVSCPHCMEAKVDEAKTDITALT